MSQFQNNRFLANGEDESFVCPGWKSRWEHLNGGKVVSLNLYNRIFQELDPKRGITVLHLHNFDARDRSVGGDSGTSYVCKLDGRVDLPMNLTTGGMSGRYML